MPDKTNTMFEGSARADARDSYAFYLNETSGICFEHLARFCQPMLELFDVDPHHWRLPNSVPDDPQLLDAYTSALAAAEMFWSYFTLDPSVRKRFLPELKAYFIGATPLPHEEADFLLLVDCMREQWTSLGEDVGRTARPSTTHSAVADDDIPELETLALFGEPLIADPALLEDPDRLDAVMSLVHDYWELARAGTSEFERMLDALVHKHGRTREDRIRLRGEAQEMVERYNELFTNR